MFCNNCSESKACFQAVFLSCSRASTTSWCLALHNTCTLGAASSLVWLYPHPHFALITDFSTLVWMPSHKVCAAYTYGCRDLFQGGIFPPQLSPQSLRALHAAAQVVRLSAVTFSCFRAVQEIQCSPILSSAHLMSRVMPHNC